MPKNYLFSLPLLLMLIIAVLSLLPDEDIPKWNVPHLDKVVHLVMYISLSASLLLALDHHSSRSLSINLFISFVISVIYGIIIEVIQERLSSGRSFDKKDVLFNIVGAGIGIWIIPLYRKVLQSLNN